jgi:glycosyltransferase involved in cell wall biosynthesis
MKILHLTAGTGSYHCGSCIRDNALVSALQQLGHETLLVPLYLPLVVDGADSSREQPLFLGGINTYLQQNLPVFRVAPDWLNRALDARPLLKQVAGAASFTDPAALGEMTLSLLDGLLGHQQAEILRLAHWIRDDARPDVVVMSNGLLAGIGQAIAEVTGVRVVCTLQSELHFVDGLTEPYRNQVWARMASALQKFDGVVAVSEYCKQQMVHRMGNACPNIVVIPSGLALEAFAPCAPNERPSLVLGYFARLSEEKGARVVLEATHALRTRPGLEDLRLEMGGSVAPGGQAFVDSLSAAAAEYGRVRIAENLSHLDKVEFLRGMSVFCVPGRMHEVAALYALEAMASGLPVVAAAEGGAGELIRATGGGVTFEAGDTAGMMDTLAELLADPAQQVAIGARGQAGVMRDFSALAMANRWVEYLDA